MKKAILILMAMSAVASSAFAWVSTPTAVKEYGFKFTLKDAATKQDKIWQTKETAPSYEEAFEKAAMACYRYYKNGERLTEERGLDIIDTCANPRSI